MSYVRTISLANRQRLQTTEPWAPPGPLSNVAHTQVANLTGNIVLTTGYNCNLAQDDTDRDLTVGAGIGAGAGIPCEDIQAYPGDTVPAGSIYLSGGPSCSQLITSINGQHGTTVKLVGQQGTTISADPTTPNQILIAFDMTDMAACTAST